MIQKYRKKPVVIEAIQYNHNLQEIKDFVGEDNLSFYEGTVGFDGCIELNVLFIKTLEGNMKVSKGDYIIKGVNGEFYPCKPDIFEKTYEGVDWL